MLPTRLPWIGTAIGQAAADEDNIDPLVKAVYEGVASQRLTLPVPIVRAGMLEKDQRLYRVRTDEGVLYVNAEELDQLESKGKAIETSTITQPGELALLTSDQLAEFRLLRYQVDSRTDLARQLDLAPRSLDGGPSLEGSWQAIQVNLPPFIDERTTQWITRSLGYQFATTPAPNLIIFNMEGNEGDVNACLSLARFIVDFDNDEVQTVAFVRNAARGPVGIVALSCDQLIMAPDARLGGHQDMLEENRFAPEELADLKPMIKALARDRQQDWSLMMSMIDPGLTVTRFRNKQSGQLRLLSNEELRAEEDAATWARFRAHQCQTGFDGQ